MKITKLLLVFLFFLLPLVHGKILPTLGVEMYFNVSGNFEFTKVIFFNIFSSVIFLSFFIENIAASFLLQRKEFRKDSNYMLLGAILLILFLSTLFSLSSFTSLIGDTEKGHTALMFFNLLGLYTILKSLDTKFLKTLIHTSLLAGIFASILAIKELFFATYDYGELSNRALGSFGHPNYLAGYLLLLLPFFSSFEKGSTRGTRRRDYLFLSILFVGIFLSKSIVAITLALGYFVYLALKEQKINKKGVFLITGMGCIISGIFLIKFFPEKLHSFLSRFYLWETTLKIIFSDIKIFLIGGGAETLPYYFNSFKSPELYIFENYGFTADRPHSFALNIFYHFGVFALGVFLYLIYTFLRNLKNTPENIAILLFLLFGIFHYFSIVGYVLVILIIILQSPHLGISSPLKEKRTAVSFLLQRRKLYEGAILSIIVLLSLLGSYYSFKLYNSEILFSQKNYTQVQETFSHPKYLIQLDKYKEAEKLEGILSQRNIREQIITQENREVLCEELVFYYSSVENYFYCGNILDGFGEETLSKKYYSQGLKKLPNLWNPDSLYWNNYFIKTTITGNRFFSPKFGDINSILERVKNQELP